MLSGGGGGGASQWHKEEIIAVSAIPLEDT
jgi:hypothetical protein